MMIDDLDFKLNSLEFKLFSELILKKSGIYLTVYKRELIKNRLLKRIIALKIKSYSEYYNYILNDKTGGELFEMINYISTNKTEFFREIHHFNFFDAYIRNNLNKLNELYIWSAGCSTGEEAYTIAIVVNEQFENIRNADIKILATDINTKVLEHAQKGIFGYERIKDIPKRMRQKYFDSIDKLSLQFKEKYKSNIRFQYLNLIEKFPFTKKFDFIFCRNVMIYFNENTRRDIVKNFYNQLKSGGYLFIGHSESLNSLDTEFKYVQPSVYER